MVVANILFPIPNKPDFDFLYIYTAQLSLVF